MHSECLRRSERRSRSRRLHWLTAPSSYPLPLTPELPLRRSSAPVALQRHPSDLPLSRPELSVFKRMFHLLSSTVQVDSGEWILANPLKLMYVLDWWLITSTCLYRSYAALACFPGTLDYDVIEIKDKKKFNSVWMKFFIKSFGLVNFDLVWLR